MLDRNLAPILDNLDAYGHLTYAVGFSPETDDAPQHRDGDWLAASLTVWMGGEKPRALPVRWRNLARDDFGFQGRRPNAASTCAAFMRPYAPQQVSLAQWEAAELPVLDAALMALFSGGA